MLQLYYAPMYGVRSMCFVLKRIALLTTFVLFLTPAVLAETSETTLSLSTAIQRTLEQNPSLKIYSFREEALVGSAFSADQKPAYEIGLEVENFAGSGELDNFSGAELTVSLSSVLELGDKRAARVGIVSDSRSVLTTQRQLESLELLAEVARRFIDTLASQSRVELAGDARQLAQETVSAAKKRVQAGAAPEADAKRAEAALAMASLLEASEQQHFEFSKLSLSSLWGASSATFSRADGDLLQFGEDIAFETLFERVSTNPAIQLFAAQERVKEAELRLAKTQSKSDISWSVGLRQLREIDDTALVAGLSMPLFSGRRNKGEVARARAERNAISVQREVSLLELRTLLFSAYSSRQQAKLAVEQLQKNVIPALEEAVTQTRIGYQRGRFGYLEYITAARELLDSKRMLIESAAAALTYGAEIEQLTADTISATQLLPNTANSGYSK